MKKISLLLIASIALFSCKLTDQNNSESEDENLPLAAKDSSVVNDKDEHGCLATAGYIWSKMNKECVKGYTGIQLNPADKPENEDETLSAFVLFSEDLNQAEVFLPNEANSVVLTRLAEGKPWVFEDWQLVPWKGYVLKKGADIKFSGDGQMGKKITGSDTQE
ncbi:hypothetical protein IVB69_01565 [Flavobacterium sp. J49]|uniref:hypothetical protein n=1 Tax=Flavobacterium sp. J49 TaxID=2718534 RepID=UPI00159355A1|nr:hypothetical protein [Flavobacterium sp. J49]MBF6640158.1 hypothetical protein [Flavobacterium sp. J49]NIC01403.1 hypothetical protein [Flavobacterium sp. J49]